jgi:hypothetical protein
MRWLLAGRVAVVAGKAALRVPDVCAAVVDIIPPGAAHDPAHAERAALRREVAAYEVRLALLAGRGSDERIETLRLELEQKRHVASVRLAHCEARSGLPPTNATLAA